MADKLRIALIEDDDAVRDALRLFLERKGAEVTCFSAAEPFMAASNAAVPFDCAVADVRMPDISGMELAKWNTARQTHPPIILITAHGDVPMAVEAMKLGAAGFLEKPFGEEKLWENVEAAIISVKDGRPAADQTDDLRARAAALSERQREVMKLAAAGLSNKEIALRLKISPRTVEIHRAWMMERMQARNLADLVRMVTMLQD